MSLVECKLVLDLLPSGKHRNGMTPERAGEHLCRMFGGFTVALTAGCWFYRDEFVPDISASYSVAIPPEEWDDFKELALVLASGQDTVYVVGPGSQAEILPVSDVIDMEAEPVKEVVVN